MSYHWPECRIQYTPAEIIKLLLCSFGCFIQHVLKQSKGAKPGNKLVVWLFCTPKKLKLLTIASQTVLVIDKWLVLMFWAGYPNEATLLPLIQIQIRMQIQIQIHIQI